MAGGWPRKGRFCGTGSGWQSVVAGLVAVAAIAVGLLITPNAAAAVDPARELAQRYAPVVRIVRQDEPCRHGEAYEPIDVRAVLDNPEVALHGPWDKVNLVAVAPSAARLSRGLVGYHLDFPGHAPSPGCTYDAWAHRLSAAFPATTYAHIATEAAHPHQLALQYWFFYVYNDFNDKHEGDWEMIQLVFAASTPAEALTAPPTAVGFSQHDGAERAAWGDAKLELVRGTHPVVYPALGSHADYYSSALYLGRSAAEGVGCDDTTGPSRELQPVVAVVPTDPAAAVGAFPWLGYQGHWGEEHRSFYDGPTGPNTQRKWAAPLTWASTSWRDKSFVVPAGSEVGSTATGFFCASVAMGSNLLTATVANPTPVVVVVSLLAVLALWLITRTEWSPAEPFTVRRPRPWGAIVVSSRRMYTGHLALFIGIGAVLLPLGVLITILQALIFRVGGLSSLVDVAGASNAVVALPALALGTFLTVLGLAVVQTLTAFAMGELDAGRRPTPLSAYRATRGALPAVLRSVLVIAVVVTVLGLTGIGGILAVWLLVRWSLVAQVVAFEHLPARAALGRSARLVRGGWWRTASLATFVGGLALLLGPATGTVLLFVSSASFDLINLVSSVVYAFVLPFVAIATTYLYFDRRATSEVSAPT